MAEKMNVKAQAEVRAHLYQVALDAVVADGKQTEIVADGALIHLGDGQYAKLKISVCDAEKFDLDGARAEYQDKLQKQADLAAKRAEAAAKKAEKAEKAAAKKADKTEG